MNPPGNMQGVHWRARRRLRYDIVGNPFALLSATEGLAGRGTERKLNASLGKPQSQLEQSFFGNFKISFKTNPFFIRQQKDFNEYVGIYMDIMMQPVVEATKEIDILNLAMKIICEAILENIYNKQIKFSICGALNLLKDFEGIAEWIENNKEVPEEFREKLMKHEVLKYCEGVGKILLREPDEVISMFPSPTKQKRMAASTDEGIKWENERRKFSFTAL